KIKEALPEIEEIFQKDPDEEIKRVCAWSIGQIDFNKLLTYLDSSDRKIKEITFETILKIDKKNIDYLIDRFDKEDTETKLKILAYMNSPNYQDKLLKIVENDKEEIPIRKEALNILKEKGNFAEIETSLWALYYNEQNDEMKNYVYQVIKEMQKRSKK
ncbi:MAG: HEAT repeat domain-containing protein, partial [bacterium]|nr:HEAT repeat domain-containing protein [bacterium]MDW8164306.1 HEAT repeat domain-containing protein [Candidatus Omnitrophota bacterium]